MRMTPARAALPQALRDHPPVSVQFAACGSTRRRQALAPAHASTARLSTTYPNRTAGKSSSPATRLVGLYSNVGRLPTAVTFPRLIPRTAPLRSPALTPDRAG